MNFVKNFFFVSISIFCLIVPIISIKFFHLYSSQIEQAQSIRKKLEKFYLEKMKIIFIEVYEVDSEGYLIMPQYQVGKKINEIEEEMKLEGFTSQQISQIEEEGRRVGMEQRRNQDMLRLKLKQENGQTQNEKSTKTLNES